MIKTNAVRALDRLGIKYEWREYDVDPNDLSAETVPAKIGLPPEQVFKTLAVHWDRNGIRLAVISANQGFRHAPLPFIFFLLMIGSYFSWNKATERAVRINPSRAFI